MRFYFTQVRGAGTDSNPFYCPLKDTQSSVFDFLDLRDYPEIEDGEFFAWTDNTDAEHQNALAQTDITYLPTEDSNGNLIQPSGLVGDISATNRQAIVTEFENRGIPTDNINLSMTVAQAMRIAFRRVRVKELLRYVDLPSLSSTIGDIEQQKRKALSRRLTNRGFDLSNINNTTTIRDALLDLMSQNINFHEAF